MPVYLYLSSVSLQLNAFMHFRTETNFACVCVCVCTPLMKMCTQVASLTLLTCVLGQGCLKFEKAVCSEGTGKESERNTHTHSHDSNHGAAVAERSSCTQMLLSSSSQDEAVLRVLCL